MDLEEQLTRSDCTLQTYQIPNCVEVHLAEANQLPYGKDNLNWSVLKCTDKLAESYGLSFSDICRLICMEPFRFMPVLCHFRMWNFI